VSDGHARTLQNGVHQAMVNFQGKVDLIFIILPTDKLEVYSAVKKTCAIDYGGKLEFIRLCNLQTFLNRIFQRCT